MEHDTKNKKLLYAIFIISIGTFLTKLMSFVMTPFYASWLSTSEYGIYDLIATYVPLCIPFATLQLDQAIYRFCMEKRYNPNTIYRKVIKIVLPLMAIVTIIITVIMILLRLDVMIIIGFISYFVTFALYNLSSEYLRGNNLLKEYSICNIIVGFTIVIASIILVRGFSLGVAGMLFVFSISYSLSLIIILIKFKPYVEGNEENAITSKELLNYSIPLIPNSISWWITNVSDRTIIMFFQGSFYNGIYAISCKIPTMLSMVFSIFNLSFQQVALQSTNDKDIEDYYNQLIKKVIRVLFSGSTVIVSATSIIYYSLLAEDYWQGIPCVPILLCGAIMLSLAQYIGDILLVDKQTKIIGLSTMIGALFNIILNLILIPRYDIIGASVATLVSYVLMFFIRFFKIKHKFIVRNVVGYILNYLLIFIGVSAFVILFGNNTLVNVLIFIASVICFFALNKDLITPIVSKVFGGRK